MVSRQSPVTRLSPPLPSGLLARRLRGVSVDGAASCQNDWPVIVIKLVGEEECAGESVILRAVVSVVLVRGDGVASKAIVRVHVRRQAVVVAENDWLTILTLNQLGRNGSVESPN